MTTKTTSLGPDVAWSSDLICNLMPWFGCYFFFFIGVAFHDGYTRTKGNDESDEYLERRSGEGRQVIVWSY